MEICSARRGRAELASRASTGGEVRELKTAKDLGMRYTRIMDWLRSANPNADMPVWLNPQKEAELIERIDAAEAKVESLIADLAQARAELARMREPVSDQEWKPETKTKEKL
jgi:DNA modification methylase